MIDLALMSKQEKIIISVSLVAVLVVLAIFLNPTGGEKKAPSAPANVLASGGSGGSGNGQFNIPRDIALDKEGNIFVVDSKNNRIQKFNAAGVYTTGWGKMGDKNGEYKEPCGIDIDKAGNVYVTDTWNGRVEVFTGSGIFIRQMGKDKGMWGPRDAAVDINGNVYVSDTGNCKILKFDNTGKLVATYGKKGRGKLEFQEPFGIKAAKDGNIYILDRKNYRIQGMTPNGQYVREIKIDGWSEGQIVNGCLMEPYFDMDPAGKFFYVSDSTNHRVIRYSFDGSKKKIFAKDKAGKAMFSCPQGVAVTGDKRIMVTDTSLNKLITFSDME